MNTAEVIANLRLMADTLEELEIEHIISCESGVANNMSCHLFKLNLTGVEATWIERFCTNYPYEKTFTYNNIRFYALYTQKDYNKEKSNVLS